MPDLRLNVLICGGGIAGGTLAALLGRSGHRVTVVERDQGVRSSGNPVDVRGAAFGVVERLDLVPRLREVATQVRRVVFVDETGRPLASMATRRSQDRELEVSRADLSAALIDAAGDVAEFRFDDTVVDLRDDGSGVDVTFERAKPGRFDLVIGADGVYSTIRRLAFRPDTVSVTSLGMYVATVYLPDLQNRSDRADTVVMYNEPGSATAVHPGTGRPGVAFMFRFPKPVDHRDRDAVGRLLTGVYGEAGWRAPEFLAAYLAADDRYFDAVSRVRLASWSNGSVALVGDAASCVSLFGEGSSTAIVGAATLADALTASPRNLTAALSHYETRHRTVTRHAQRAVPIVSHLLIPSSSIGISLRTLALRLASRRPASE